MLYFDGSTVRLCDIVSLAVPNGAAKARVVMLGDTYEHLEIDARFLEWVTAARVLRKDSVVAEWLDVNPFAHDDARFAPVGNYMFSAIDEWVTRDT